MTYPTVSHEMAIDVYYNKMDRTHYLYQIITLF